MRPEVVEVAKVTERGTKEKRKLLKKKEKNVVVKCLSVLGSKLLDQVLQGSELSPVDEVELLQEQNI